jgi:FkbM family methyltransferase
MSIIKRILNKLSLYWDFLIAFVLIEYNIKKSIHLKHIKEPIRLRRKTSDIKVFGQIFAKQEYEIALHLPYDFIPKVIVDCGGNIGLATVYFKNRYKDAKIISIEPDKGNFAILQQNIKNYDDVIGINSAVWSKSTYLKIENANAAGWGFIVKEATLSDENSFIATSISDLMKKYELERIDILKMDIEGAEKEIFSASDSGEWLKKTHVLVVETHDFMVKGTASAVFKALQKYDYHFANVGENLIFVFDHAQK